LFYPDESNLRRKIDLISKKSGSGEIIFSEIPFPKCIGIVKFDGGGSRSEAEEEIILILDEYLIFNGRFVSYNAYHILTPTVSTANAILNKVRTVQGVKMARVDFVEEWLGAGEILKAKVDGKIREMDSCN
jgi:hypothetical protein